MPSRNRAREAAKAAAGDPPSPGSGRKNKKRKRKASKTKQTRSDKDTNPPKRPRTGPMLDPSAADDAETRFVQPYEATKTYVCPGCGRDILPGVGHLVAVPPDEPDLRRHWHRGCWANRHTRF